MPTKTEIPKKERILEAAEKVFSTHGYERATVDEIMMLADVGKGTIYNYFGNKEQLFYKLVEGKNEAFVQQLQEAVSHKEELKEKLIAFFEVMIEFYRANAPLWQIIFFEMVGGSNGCLVTMVEGKPQVVSRFDVEPSEKLKEQMLRYHYLLESEFSILQRIIEGSIAAGEIKPIDAEMSTAFVFFGVAMCIFHPHAGTENMTALEGARQTVDRYLYGALI